MIEPIRLSFEVRCPPDHAFATWTERTSTWWPGSHTVSGAADLEVHFEARVGGRIFERTPSGEEHDWGEILAWEPPRRLAYLWHLKADPRDATEVEIRFVGAGRGDHARRDRASRLGSGAGGRGGASRRQSRRMGEFAAALHG